MNFMALHGIWVDLVIVLILIFFIHQGFVNGFWSILIDFVSFFGSLLISLKIYSPISSLLVSNFSVSSSISNAAAFLISSIFIEIILSFIMSFLIKKIPKRILKNHITRVLGVILSVGQAVILIAFVLTLAISLPISPVIKTDISKSKIGNLILNRTSIIEKYVNNIFGKAISESLTYVTVEPKSHESVTLDNKSDNLKVDRDTETQMFALVNNERTTRNIGLLSWDIKLVVVAENYATFMWKNKYFGHYDSEGHDISYRLGQALIAYSYAGENLALAPTLETAHTGLMNSPGHKANILEPKFKKIGIGVIDNGFYGKMFVQVFTD